MVCGDTVHGLDRRTQAQMQARIRHKARSTGMGAEVSTAEYKSVRGKLRTADLEQENIRLRSKIRSYESTIERNDLWHIFNPRRNKTRNRDDTR